MLAGSWALKALPEVAGFRELVAGCSSAMKMMANKLVAKLTRLPRTTGIIII